jgi:hypothetical protein
MSKTNFKKLQSTITETKRQQASVVRPGVIELVFPKTDKPQISLSKRPECKPNLTNRSNSRAKQSAITVDPNNKPVRKEKPKLEKFVPKEKSQITEYIPAVPESVMNEAIITKGDHFIFDPFHKDLSAIPFRFRIHEFFTSIAKVNSPMGVRGNRFHYGTDYNLVFKKITIQGMTVVKIKTQVDANGIGAGKYILATFPGQPGILLIFMHLLSHPGIGSNTFKTGDTGSGPAHLHAEVIFWNDTLKQWSYLGHDHSVKLLDQQQHGWKISESKVWK